ncbi:BTAD domain-containing putative transcriptional regulator [Nocardia sp. NPDC051321]|uniref:AfsR/SARP family transcriptional regulator n=1 Tax=Nocardia sp. NPDC051321 TaxID=3364323 RepID=UPI00379BD4A1
MSRSIGRYSATAESSGVDIRLLGELAIAADGFEHKLPGARRRALVAVLALRAGTVVSTAALVEELRITGSARQVTNSLQAHVARLRTWLDQRFQARELLRTHESGYCLRISPDRIDTNRFAAALATASAVAPQQPHKRLAALETALELWRGPALVDAGDGLICRQARDHLHELKIAAHEDLMQELLTLGYFFRVTLDIQELIVQYPLRERLREQLMMALAYSGRHAEAVEAYHAFRHLLGSELGLDPSPALHATLGRILRHDLRSPLVQARITL